jgi:hypothetical protein
MVSFDADVASLRSATGDHPSPYPTRLAWILSAKNGPPTSEKIPQRQVSQADIGFAVELLNTGETAESVHGKLVERGMTPERASALLNELFVPAVYSDAIALLNQGHSPEQVTRQLADKGLEKSVVAAVVALPGAGRELSTHRVIPAVPSPPRTLRPIRLQDSQGSPTHRS